MINKFGIWLINNLVERHLVANGSSRKRRHGWKGTYFESMTGYEGLYSNLRDLE